jgi:hypothetical protein
VTVFTPSPATATAGGYDAAGVIDVGILPGRATAGGYAALVHGAAPSASAAPDALRLEILTATGTQLLNDLVARRNLTFSVEHNGSGNISFETDLSALTGGIDSPLLDPSNLVRVHFGDLAAWPYGVAEGLITSAPPTKKDDDSWSLQVQCPGSWDVLDFGVLWPPAGATGDTREFSYTAGMTGPAFVPEEWSTPSGKRVKTSFRWTGHRWPRGWREAQSSWLWSSSPEKKSPLGTRQFLGDPFTLAQTENVRFRVAGDDTLKLYLNGARIKTKGRGAWHRTSSFVRKLNAGTYTVAAAVQNTGAAGKAGFIFSAETLKADGTHKAWLLRSATNSFQIKTAAGYFAQVPLPPDGWYPPAVLWQHVGEAAARGVDFHPSIALTFTNMVDSNGSAWTAKGPAEYDIGTSGAELGEKVRALGYDLAMLPGLRLSAWKQRGFDLRDRVVISTPLGAGWSSRAWPRVRSVGLTHHESGWTETAGAAAVSAEFGRRELAISGGGVDGDLQADAFAAAAMTPAASPEETIEVTITSADMVVDATTGKARAPMPFRDFNVADTITVETVGGFQPIKVMSIACAEQETKETRWTIAGYPV